MIAEKKIVVRDLPADERAAFSLVVAGAIMRGSTRFRDRRLWPYCVVVVGAPADSKPRITTRADFAQWARAHDLLELAREVVRIPTRAREILLCVVGEDDLGLVAIDLRGAFSP